MCKHLIINGSLGQCRLAAQFGNPPQIAASIRAAFKAAALRNHPDLNNGPGVAGGPPNCMFYTSKYVTWADCPEYTP